VKLTDQDVPPEFAALYAELVATNAAPPGATTTARTRRKARRPKPQRAVRDQLYDVIDACDQLADRLHYEPGSRERSDFRYAQTREILSGYFNPDYWATQASTSEIILASAPTSINDPNPPPYSYRRADNLPTRPTFPAGVPAAGNPRYTGATAAGRFADAELVWTRTLYTLDFPISSKSSEPVFFQLAASMVIDTDTRGSRPMCSFLLARTFAPAASLDPNDPTPPTQTPLSFYWRYKPPLGAAPYYHVAQDRALIYRLYPRAAELAAAPLRQLALVLAPRPMFGRAFNNNFSVAVEMVLTKKLVQLRRTFGLDLHLLVIDAYPAAIAGDGSSIVGYAFGAANGRGFRWRAPDTLSLWGTLTGGTWSEATGTSLNGEVSCGRADQNGIARPILWTLAGGLAMLASFHPASHAGAWGISDNALLVAGYADYPLEDPDLPDHIKQIPTACYWDVAGGPYAIAPITIDSYSAANAISQAGPTIAGAYSDSTDQFAFRWTPGAGFQYLPPLTGAHDSVAYGISADGQTIVGYSGTGTVYAACRWTVAGGAQSLGTLPGGSQAVAYDANADGSIIVGGAMTPTGERPFRWTAAGGMQPIDVPAQTSSAYAIAISNDGERITGYATIGGVNYTVLWGPLPD
jgi:uncharacterized membrane protein